MVIELSPAKIQRDRILGAYARARVAMDDAVRKITTQPPAAPGTVAALREAVEELSQLLKELEKPCG